MMEMQEPSTFGELLRRYRVAAMLTQEELAARAGLSMRAVSDLERGVKSRPHQHTVRQLARALGLTASETAGLDAAVVRVRGSASAAAPAGRAAIAAAGEPVLHLVPAQPGTRDNLPRRSPASLAGSGSRPRWPPSWVVPGW